MEAAAPAPAAPAAAAAAARPMSVHDLGLLVQVKQQQTIAGAAAGAALRKGSTGSSSIHSPLSDSLTVCRCALLLLPSDTSAARATVLPRSTSLNLSVGILRAWDAC
jgi:hypothetical protein